MGFGGISQFFFAEISPIIFSLHGLIVLFGNKNLRIFMRNSFTTLKEKALYHRQENLETQQEMSEIG